MKLNSQEYRQWKVRQNKKNLRRRTRKKEIIRFRRSKQIMARVRAKAHTETFHAPEIFSFIQNPEGTTTFFEQLTSFIMEKRHFGQDLFIDISKIQFLSIDALMYLIAIVNNLNSKFKAKYTFRGNFPQDEKSKQLIRKAGFHHFVSYVGETPIERDADNVQIVSGDLVIPGIAKRICDFVMEKGKVTKRSCSFLYNMIIELMSNAHNHAYLSTGENGEFLYRRWYCFADYDTVQNSILFTFMDTGEGIPSTVKKHGLEYIDFLGLKGDGAYVLSAMQGKLRRSQTKLPYRGKGLPRIYGTCLQNKIQNMRIISNHADVTINTKVQRSNELSHSLRGTLFYWSLDLSNLLREV